jgi:hypothetical protein
MKSKRKTFIGPGDWLLVMLGYVLLQACILPMLNQAVTEIRHWHPFATPTPTPLPVTLDVSSEDEAAARDAYYGWLREHHGLHATPDAELEDRAYYLAGEAPRLRLYGQWPQWWGLRYAVGPASGQWTTYWAGSRQGYDPYSRRVSMATLAFPDLAEAERVGAAVVWRADEPYLAVVWPGLAPTPQAVPPLTGAGAEGPGW